ncbi:MAG: aspartate kinase [Alphaproteobacteria bacterium]|nr:aspartate kinase [Alphaproteobacteria bacterium]
MTAHSVEKIGGTSMSRFDELLPNLIIGERAGDDIYRRCFVVSAFGGVTNLLLEDKKTGEPGVYGLFAASESGHVWAEALDRVTNAMIDHNHRLLGDSGDRQIADAFVRERVEGARSCLIDLQRICAYGHFQIEEHLMTIREMLAGLGEAHSAHTATLMLRRAEVNARFVDLSGWRDEHHPSLDRRIADAIAGIDFASEMPVVTGYAQAKEGLMRQYDRGYSEVTFAKLAALSGAREAVIHKEFHLSSADPKLVGAQAVHKIGRTNYDVADQLSNLGMEAIHPNAAKTLRQAAIPLRVANAFEPEDPGTVIDSNPTDTSRVEMITGLDVVAFQVFEQDMVGVKGYDQKILETLTRHGVRIVCKASNANSIVHYVDASLKLLRRVEADVKRAFPAAEISIQKISLVSALGASLSGVKVLQRGLVALDEAGIRYLATQDGIRQVDVQFFVGIDDRDQAIQVLHRVLIENTDMDLSEKTSEDVDDVVSSAPRPSNALVRAA